MMTIILLVVVYYVIKRHTAGGLEKQTLAELRAGIEAIGRAETLLKSAGYVVYLKKRKESDPFFD